MNYRLIFFPLMLALAACGPADREAPPPVENHRAEDGQQHGEEQSKTQISMDETQISLAEIRVEPLRTRIVEYRYYAPGEVTTNDYRSYLLSPRVNSVVVKRHAVLGQHVQQGAPLVTLTSEVVASAQETLHRSADDWRRVQKLGREFVGDKQYVLAQSSYRSARGKLQSLGLTESAIVDAADGKLQSAGEYTLTAVIDGVVLADNFHQGQAVSAGDKLLELASERELWVEARLPADSGLALPADSPALVRAAGGDFAGRVSQEAHAIDPETRTRIVRLLVDNRSHRLHPGMFADVYFLLKTPQPVTVVP